jgi:chromosome segregation and condensation protein ScpB
LVEKKRLREAINSCDNEAEKARLMAKLQEFDDQMMQQVRDESAQQDQKLRAALEARRRKRGMLIEELNAEKHGVIKQTYQDRVNQLVNDQYNEKYAEHVANKI